MLAQLKKFKGALQVAGLGALSLSAISAQAQAAPSYNEALATLKTNGCTSLFSEEKQNCYGFTQSDLVSLDLFKPSSDDTNSASWTSGTWTEAAQEIGLSSYQDLLDSKELQDKVLNLKVQADLDAMSSFIVGSTTPLGTKVTPAVAAVCAEVLGPKGCENYLTNGRFAFNSFQTAPQAFEDAEAVMKKFAKTTLSSDIDAPEIVTSAVSSRSYYRGAASTGYMQLASAAGGSPDDPTCPPELWDAMLQQAANNVNDQVDQRREQVEPPDSVLDLSCFDALTLGGISSVSIFFDPSVLINAVLGMMQEYICDKATEAWNKTLGREFDLSSYVKEYDGIIPGLSVEKGGNILDGASPVTVGVGAFPSTGIVLPETVGGGIVRTSDRADGYQAQFPEGTFRIPCADPAREQAGESCRSLPRLSEHLAPYFQ